MKISVITVCKNSGNNLEKTVKSVLAQTYPNKEYVVVDGGSTDDTKKILKRYGKKIEEIISEKDKGIYDAMNKGINRATGEILLFMNSGDTFYDNDVVKRVVSNWPNIADIVYGDVYLNKERKFKDQSNVGKPFLMCDNICHQSMFIKKQCFKDIGLFNIKYKIAADYDWLLQAIYVNELVVKHVNIAIANYEGGGKSADKKLFDYEQKEILKKNFSTGDIFVNKLIYKITDFTKKLI